MDPTKFVAKKSKAAAKKGVGNTQVRSRTAGLLALLAMYAMFYMLGHPRCAASQLVAVVLLHLNLELASQRRCVSALPAECYAH